MADAETAVCRSAKQIPPASSMRTALNDVSSVDVLDVFELKLLPTRPRLKISNSAPKTIPRIPASDNIRLVVREKQWIAPNEQIKLIPSTTRNEVPSVEGSVKDGYTLWIGIVRRVMMRLTTPPITNIIAARSTKPCFNGEAPFIFFEPPSYMLLGHG